MDKAATARARVVAQRGTRRLPVAVVGLGRVSQIAHLRFLRRESDRFDLRAVVDVRRSVAEATAARYDVPSALSSVAELAGSGVEAIVCATPAESHPDVVTEALEAGLHVLCEKPVATSVDGCDRMIAARDAAARAVQVGYMKRFDPSVERLLSAVAGVESDLQYVAIHVSDPTHTPFVDPEVLERAAIPEHAVVTGPEAARDPGADARRALDRCFLGSMLHEVNLVHAVMAARGERRPLRLQHAAYWRHGWAVHALWRLPSGAPVNAAYLRLPGVPEYRETLAFYFEDRVFELAFSSPYQFHAPARLVERSAEAAGGLVTRVASPSFDEPFQLQLRSFHEAVTEGREVRNPLEEARADTEVVIEAHRSAVETSGDGSFGAAGPS